MQKYYRVLGVLENASLPEVKKAYRKLVLLYHPDTDPHNESLHQRFREVQEAYNQIQALFRQKRKQQERPQPKNAENKYNSYKLKRYKKKKQPNLFQRLFKSNKKYVSKSQKGFTLKSLLWRFSARQFIQQLENSHNRYVCIEAAKALQQFSSTASIAALIEAARSKDPDIRKQALASLRYHLLNNGNSKFRKLWQQGGFEIKYKMMVVAEKLLHPDFFACLVLSPRKQWPRYLQIRLEFLHKKYNRFFN